MRHRDTGARHSDKWRRNDDLLWGLGPGLVLGYANKAAAGEVLAFLAANVDDLRAAESAYFLGRDPGRVRMISFQSDDRLRVEFAPGSPAVSQLEELTVARLRLPGSAVGGSTDGRFLAFVRPPLVLDLELDDFVLDDRHRWATWEIVSSSAVLDLSRRNEQ